MIPLLGSNKRLCDGISRRDLLHVGGLGCFGVGMTDFLRWKSNAFAAEAAPSPEITANFGKAKACILLFLFGSPPQHETFDPKPEAPVEVQGEMKAIPTSVPGLDICEGLPKSARIMDRVTVIRSMTHPYPLHGVAYALTGMPTYTPAIEAKPRDPQHWPFLGSVVDYLERPARGQPAAAIPRNMGLPWLMGSKCDLAPLAGPYAAFLGNTYDPVWTDFDGKGTRVVPKLSDGQTNDVIDPFGGCEPTGKFRLSATTPLPEMSTGRFELRQSLLSQFDDRRKWLDSHSGVSTWADHRQSAYSMLSAGRIRDALDIHQESPEMRDRYGMTLFGQSCLAARRLVEAGGRFVSVFWDPFGPFGGSCWDTHANHYPRLKDYLLPVFDQSYAALILDLEQRGLLDETLVLVLSEHGRTPKIDSKPRGAARHHWSRAYSAVMAGGGVAKGRVVGRTDESGGDVASNPFSPKDVLATSLHLLGIDPHAAVPDRLGRPVVAAGDGIVRTDVL
ncbi:MAG: DUF1501 domain-containing protein [Planctomycetaceae bacterium]|nr:DUF1501 domain-containing protein [Planctomycetaceae bacterium]